MHCNHIILTPHSASTTFTTTFGGNYILSQHFPHECPSTLPDLTPYDFCMKCSGVDHLYTRSRKFYSSSSPYVPQSTSNMAFCNYWRATWCNVVKNHSGKKSNTIINISVPNAFSNFKKFREFLNF